MATHCVNFRDSEVVSMAKQLGIHPAAVASKIAIWQNENGLENFPTIDDISDVKTPFVIKSNINDLSMTPEKIEKIYTNYVNLMGRKREGKELDKEGFENVLANLQVFNYKDSYIFGEWDKKNKLFKGRFISAPNIRELYSAIDMLKSNVDFMASVPGDMGKMLEKKGMFKIDTGKGYNFRGEDMVKNLYFSNRELAERVFDKPAEDVTNEDVVAYDKFYNYWSIVGKIGKAFMEKDFTKMYHNLKELGMYDYNAYRYFKRSTNKDLTEEEIKDAVKVIKRNADNNIIDIDKTDLVNNPDLYKQLDNELNKTLANYLGGFAIKTEMLDEMQNQLGMDSREFLDTLNRIIYISKQDQQNYPQHASRFIAYMMQYNPLVSEILSTLKKQKAYSKMEKEELLDVVGDLIAAELHKKTDTTMPSDLLAAVKQLIKDFFEMLTTLRLNRVNDKVAEIAHNILIQNKAMVRASPYKPGAYSRKTSPVDLAAAFKLDKFAAEIADKMADHFPLGGSASMAEQGIILRPEENQVHDLDWPSSLPREESMKLFESIFPDAVYIRNIADKSGENTDTWMVVPDGYRIENMTFHKGKKKAIDKYDIVDKSTGEVVSTYNGLDDKYSGEVEGKPIDIFSTEEGSIDNHKSFQFELESGKMLNLSNWRNSFKAKQRYGRIKDIWDYNRFVPNEMINNANRKVDLDEITDMKSKKEAFTSAERTTEAEALETGYLAVNKELMFSSNMKTVQTASDVLQSIISSDILYETKEGAFFLQKAFNLLNKSGAKVRILSTEDFNNKLDGEFDKTMMLYDSDKNEIYMTEEALNKYTPTQVAQSFIHEVVHSTTVKAYFDPQTFEEHELKKFIDKAFEQYKELGLEEDSAGNLMYGFTNQAEFIAEIYSNPNFRAKIEELEKGWWNRFKDAVRRLFGLTKSSVSDQLISSAMLFETVEGIAEKDNYAWKGAELGMFAKKEEFRTELKTIEEKLQHNIDRINESLKINIDKYEMYAKYYKDNEGINYYIEKLTKLQKEINSYNKANQIKGIILFLEKMGETLDYVEKKLDNIDSSDPENIKKTAKLQDQYLTTYNVIGDIKELIGAITESEDDIISKEDLERLNELFDVRSGKFDRLNARILELKKKVAKDLLTNIQYFPNVEKKHRDRLLREYNANNISADKELWISYKLNNRDRDMIEKDLEKEVRSFLNNPAFDIYSSDVMFNSAINVSSPMVQIMYQLLNEVENKRLEDERVKDIEFGKLFKELVNEKGTNNVNELYKNITQKDSNGQVHLVGEYDVKFYSDVHMKIKDMRREMNAKIKELELKKVELSDAGKINTNEYTKIANEVKTLKEQNAAAVDKIQKANMTFDNKGKVNGIQEKWKNKVNMSKTEKKILDFFIDIQNETQKKTFGRNNDSIIKYTPQTYAAKFYELPRVTKSDAERMWQGDITGTVKDKWKDLTTVRPDDIGFQSVDTDMKNESIRKLKIHYRDKAGNFENKDQSMDLFNVYRLEYKNGSAYKQRSDAETDLNFLLDIAKHQKYYEVKGTDVLISNRNKKANMLEGSKSQTVKMMQNMLEMKLYDIHNKSASKMSKVDANKAVDFINSASAFLTLSLNIASGTANVVNANAQLFLESFIKGHFIKAEGIKKANAIYGSDLKNNISDSVNGIKDSFTNQVLEMFNVKGDMMFSEANFLKSDLIKAGLSTDSLRVFQESGEHWVQSVITMATLDGIKVLSANNKYLNKEGKEVEMYSEAASLLDMLDKDDKGLVVINPLVHYTTHSRMSSIKEGGKEKIDMLVIKKINDSLGNYRKTDQAEMYRHWLGKLLGLYRKYLVPMGIARWRGIEHFATAKEDLEEHQKRFSYALQEDEEGTYVTLLRWLYQGLKSKEKWLNLKTNWENMSDYEKHNVKRAVTEALMTAVILPLSVMLVGAAADDDDDNELLYFAAYQLKRLDTELSSYRNISEMMKMLRSPIPSTRLLETGVGMVGTVFSGNMMDEYESGPHKGENKLKIKAEKQLPLFRDFLKSYKESLEFQSRPGGGFGS